MQGRNWVILAIAVVVGLFAVVIANAYFSGMETRNGRVAEAGQSTQIVVAAQPLAFGSALTSENVRLQRWPAASVPEGAFRTVADALKDRRVALGPVVRGEPILASKVSGNRATLAAVLPEGMRAVSVPVDATTGVGGFVLPGTAVDVILTRAIPGDAATPEDMRSDAILQNAQVLAIDQEFDRTDGKPRVAKTATLAVSLHDAQRLAVASRIGTLSLALRKDNELGDDALAGLAGSNTITNRELGGRRLLVTGQRPAAGRPAAMMPAAVIAAPARGGRNMTVIRGTEPTDYPVGRLGG